jgi:hydrogenase/urease accessory protein HupE
MVALVGMAEGHSMKQVRSEISVADGAWSASVWLEAWALYPEDGPKVPPGTPGDPNTAGNSWVKTLAAADHRGMREVAAEFLSETFLLTLDGQKLKADYGFPDYAASEQAVLEENAMGNALVRIDLSGKFPEGAKGPLKLVWADDEDEPLVLEVRFPDSGKTGLRRIEPRQAPEELMRIGADGKVQAAEGGTSLFTWIAAGFHHILPLGLDHICFILGLFFLQPRLRPLLWQTSAFTLAHSITLALVVLGVITAPAKIVEPMIALSIAYVGIENLWVRELKPWRVALVFGLGLLHGMGFASVMKELDLPEGEVIKPLIGFNVGVECGQVTVLVLAFVATFWFITHSRFRIVSKIASFMIALVGLYWTYERVFL